MAQQGGNFIDRLGKIKTEREPQADKGSGFTSPLRTTPSLQAYIDLEPPLVTDKEAKKKINKHSSSCQSPKRACMKVPEGGPRNMSSYSPLTWDSTRASTCRSPQQREGH